MFIFFIVMTALFIRFYHRELLGFFSNSSDFNLDIKFGQL